MTLIKRPVLVTALAVVILGLCWFLVRLASIAPDMSLPHVRDYTHPNGMHCVLVYGPYSQPSGISCDWQAR